MSAHTVMVPGPMHPDMFDGETPMLVPIEIPEMLALFRVERNATLWQPTEIKETYWLLAENSEDAYERTTARFERVCADRESEVGGGSQVDLDDNVDTTVEIPFEEAGKHFSDAAQFLQQLVDNHGEDDLLDEDHLQWSPGRAA